MTHKQRVVKFQKSANRFTRGSGLGIPPLMVDGDKGAATRKRIRTLKYLLGFGRKRLNAKLTEEFLWQLEHPRRAKPIDTAFKSRHPQRAEDLIKRRRKRVRLGAKRRAVRRRWYAQNQFKAFLKPGVGFFDGKPVAKVAIPQLRFARAHGWQGRLVSGWRDPKYSQQLCYNMCGHPSCPGRCAGLSSNHVGNSPAKYAKDVSDYVRYGQLMARPDCPRPRVFNALGSRDPVHYSPSGR